MAFSQASAQPRALPWIKFAKSKRLSIKRYQKHRMLRTSPVFTASSVKSVKKRPCFQPIPGFVSGSTSFARGSQGSQGTRPAAAAAEIGLPGRRRWHRRCRRNHQGLRKYGASLMGAIFSIKRRIFMIGNLYIYIYHIYIYVYI